MTEPQADKTEQDAQAAKPAKPEKPAEAKPTEPAEAKPKTQSLTAPPLPEGVDYIWGTGRRRTAVARVRIRPGSGKILINKRQMEDYFHQSRDRQSATAPIDAVNMRSSWDVWVNVNGGGYSGQAGAVMLGLARALSKALPEAESTLRDKGLLTRDPRMKERKKPGQPGARKRFQYSKR